MPVRCHFALSFRVGLGLTSVCRNFLKLCRVKYYNYAPFYNVQRDFTAITGDQTATGTGGMSVYGLIKGPEHRYFDDEIRQNLRHAEKGTVSMANDGPNKNDSKFFFTLRDGIDYLDDRHTIFGKVAEGLDVLDKINEAYVDKAGRPYQDIRIRHTIVLDDPFDDPPGLVVPDASPVPTKEQLAVRAPLFLSFSLLIGLLDCADRRRRRCL